MVTKKKPEDLVLSALSKLGECNFNTLRKETKLGYYTLSKTINRLVARGLVVEKRIGRLRIIRLVETP